MGSTCGRPISSENVYAILSVIMYVCLPVTIGAFAFAMTDQLFAR